MRLTTYIAVWATLQVVWLSARTIASGELPSIGMLWFINIAIAVAAAAWCVRDALK